MGNLPSSCLENEPTKTGLLTIVTAAKTPNDDDPHNSTFDNRSTPTRMSADDPILTDSSNSNCNNDAGRPSLRRRRSLFSFLRPNNNNTNHNGSAASADRRSLHSSSYGRAAGGTSWTSRNIGSRTNTTTTNNKPKKQAIQLPKGTVLLKGCQTAEEHCDVIRQALDGALGLEGDRGLRGMGFEYRLLPCDEHKDGNNTAYQPHQQPQHHQSAGDAHSGLLVCNHQPPEPVEEELMPLSSTSERLLAMKKTFYHSQPSDVQSRDGSEDLGTGSYHGRRSLDDLESFSQTTGHNGSRACNLCSHRLFHIASCEMVNEQNRKERIADGSMYDRICELAQESAQAMMMREGELEWVTVVVDDDNDKNTGVPQTTTTPPLRVLVSTSRNSDRETKSPLFVVCTGRGKVRAGIFTRHHLMCTGLESATGTYLLLSLLSSTSSLSSTS
jgi:hypothetical protein